MTSWWSHTISSREKLVYGPLWYCIGSISWRLSLVGGQHGYTYLHIRVTMDKVTCIWFIVCTMHLLKPFFVISFAHTSLKLITTCSKRASRVSSICFQYWTSKGLINLLSVFESDILYRKSIPFFFSASFLIKIYLFLKMTLILC